MPRRAQRELDDDQDPEGDDGGDHNPDEFLEPDPRLEAQLPLSLGGIGG